MSKLPRTNEDGWVNYFIVGFLIAVPTTLWIDYRYLSPLDPGSVLMVPFAMFLTLFFGGVTHIIRRMVGFLVEYPSRKEDNK